MVFSLWLLLLQGSGYKLSYRQMLHPWLLSLTDVACKAHDFCCYSGQEKLGSERVFSIQRRAVRLGLQNLQI